MKNYLLIVLALLSGCSSTGIVHTGSDTFMVAKTGGAPGTSGGEVTADLYREAYSFCAAKNMDLEKISVEEEDWRAFVTLANSKLEFRCIEKAEHK